MLIWAQCPNCGRKLFQYDPISNTIHIKCKGRTHAEVVQVRLPKFANATQQPTIGRITRAKAPSEHDKASNEGGDT